MGKMRPEVNDVCQTFARSMALRMLGTMKLPMPTGGPMANCSSWADDGVFEAVYEEVSKLDPASLGMLAASGGGRNYDVEGTVTSDGYAGTDNYLVHCSGYVNKYASGWTVLRRLAATSLVARMYDIRIYEQDTRRTPNRTA